MPQPIAVTIHPTQFPERVAEQLRHSLRAREMDHQFLYEGRRQSRRWLALHEACSPARTDRDCLATYERGFREAAERLSAAAVHVISLGCGGGQKDVQLLRLLRKAGKRIFYSPVDVSVPLVLTAAEAARAECADTSDLLLAPTVCDLAETKDLRQRLSNTAASGAERLVTFFGMIPNFAPDLVLPRLAVLLGPDDWLLCSANLAPGRDYAAGVRQILPLYQNDLTNEWLLGFLWDLGFEPGDGELRWSIEADAGNFLRIVARFHFLRACKLVVEGEEFHFEPTENLRVFFSYRYAPAQIAALAQEHHLAVVQEWITRSEDEGVFLCRRETQVGDEFQ